MIYGEIFMNIERGSKRTSEISKLLCDTYQSEIQFTSDTSVTTSFCQQATIAATRGSKTVKLPFCMIYEPTLLMSLDFEKEITMHVLDKIRTAFVQNYFKMGHDKTYPNILFDYQDRIQNAGHLEAYNHWILMKGDEDEFNIWELANKEKWTRFIQWFSDNGLQVNASNKFFRGQY